MSLPGAGGQPDRLVIDLARVSGKAFLQSVAKPPMRIEGREQQIASATYVNTPKTRQAKTGPEVPQPSRPDTAAASVDVPEKPLPPSIANAINQAKVKHDAAETRLASLRVPMKPPVPGQAQKRVIVIDPGHGGVDPGAIGVSGIYEKHITLAAARDLKRYLEATGRFDVKLTRDRDIFIRLRGRIERAREMKADLFISLHADTIRNRGVRGLSLYTLSERASDKEAAQLAERENKADLIAGIDLTHESAEVTNILIDLAQRETMNQSAKLAALLVDELDGRVNILRNPHRFAGFAVLKAPDIPSVLIELGFLSNKEDERQLRSKSHRRKLAQSIAGAVDRYFAKIESASR
ncbi:MAG: N-acetylmuramoyl-L-alanine amidase [Rhodospirillales bacterium]|nr:N-acetylmuramoyl-L-alanine amidase [Rhodospirillales bacterium]